MRQKLTADAQTFMPRLLDPIIRQGIAEGVFTTRFPEQAAMIVAGVSLNLTDTIIGLLLDPQPGRETLAKLEIMLRAYIDAIERIIGAPEGSLNVFDRKELEDWLTIKEEEGA